MHTFIDMYKHKYIHRQKHTHIYIHTDLHGHIHIYDIDKCIHTYWYKNKWHAYINAWTFVSLSMWQICLCISPDTIDAEKTLLNWLVTPIPRNISLNWSYVPTCTAPTNIALFTNGPEPEKKVFAPRGLKWKKETKRLKKRKKWSIEKIERAEKMDRSESE